MMTEMRRAALIVVTASCAISAGCYSSAPGTVHASEDNPIVTVGAGYVEVGGGSAYYGRYIVDRATQVCWFFAGDSLSPLDCCALARVPQAQQYITWITPASCSATSSIPTPTAPLQ